MKKFLVLVKKEIRELITIQVVLPIIITVILFMAIGQVIGSETQKSEEKQNLIIADYDASPTSHTLQNLLKAAQFNTIDYSPNDDELTLFASSHNASLILEIPEDFGASIERLEPKSIKTTLVIENLSLMTNMNSAALTAISQIVNRYAAQSIANSNSDNSLANIDINQPIAVEQYVSANEVIVQENPDAMLGFVSQQTAFIPIILFIIILLASQMIAGAIATEKENKTLETLLSLPIKRVYIVSSKMVGAGIVSAIIAIIYIFGFRNYMENLSGTWNIATSDTLNQSVRALGLSFDTNGYVLLGLSLFFSILAALAISIIVGVFAQDIKSVQALITPLMILITIPYIASMFLDVGSLAAHWQIFIYAIPFSHPFLASGHIFFGNQSYVIYGIIYQAIFFAVFVFIAAKIFSSDKIITLKLSFAKKNKD